MVKANKCNQITGTAESELLVHAKARSRYVLCQERCSWFGDRLELNMSLGVKKLGIGILALVAQSALTL